MNLSRLKLITFDVTETLLEFRSALGKQYSEIGAIYGVNCEKNALAANFKTHWYQMNKEHPNFGYSTIGWRDWWQKIVFRTFKDADLNIADEKLEIISNHLIDIYKTNQCWQQCYGALGLLSFLRNKGIHLGVISNFDERLSALLKSTRLRHYFKFVLSSYEAGFEKPDMKIFEEAIKLSEISGLKSQQCLHVGDTPALDYFGARNAGWNAVLINEENSFVIKNKYTEIDPKYVYRNLYDLHKYFIDFDDKVSRNQVQS